MVGICEVSVEKIAILKIYVKWFFSDHKGGNKLLSVAKISARQVLCCYC